MHVFRFGFIWCNWWVYDVITLRNVCVAWIPCRWGIQFLVNHRNVSVEKIQVWKDIRWIQGIIMSYWVLQGIRFRRQSCLVRRWHWCIEQEIGLYWWWGRWCILWRWTRRGILWRWTRWGVLWQGYWAGSTRRYSGWWGFFLSQVEVVGCLSWWHVARAHIVSCMCLKYLSC